MYEKTKIKASVAAKHFKIYYGFTFVNILNDLKNCNPSLRLDNMYL